jgi:hypothetical protein
MVFSLLSGLLSKVSAPACLQIQQTLQMNPAVCLWCREAALKCLNHMICNAMEHAPRCLEYMEKIRNRQIFSFCAIPQIMAIATLSMCFNNGLVFEGVVKMRRGQTAKVWPCSACNLFSVPSENWLPHSRCGLDFHTWYGTANGGR